MTRSKSTKKALLMSAVSLLLCFVMLLGTTFAWFTDSVTSANNIIKSGNLDIELEYWKDGKWVDVASKADILTNELWEPGVTEVAYLRVANAGSLALKYQLGINIVSETAGVNVAGETFKLSNYIKFGVKEITATENTEAPATYATREEAVAAVEKMEPEQLGSVKKISAGYTDAASMASGDVFYLALVVYMPTTVGNEANHDGEHIPEIQLGINVMATQVSAEVEQDSFGPDYDDGAFIPVAPETIPEDMGDALELKSSAESNVTVTVPATVVNGLDDSVTSLTVAASAPIVNTTNKTVTFSTIELQDQNGKEVDLSAVNAKVTVTLPVGDAFADGEQVEVYHDGKFVTYAKVENGNISYEVSHFCEVEVKAAEEVVLDNTIDSVKEFIAFANAVNAGNSYEKQTVVLGADLDLKGVTWTPIGTSANPFKGTFDGNGKVIKNLSVLMAGKSDIGLFGNTQNGEIKNVTVENAKIAGRLNVGVVAGQPYTTKYSNITVKGHVEVDGLAYVGAVGGKNAYANWNNITVDVDATSYVDADSREDGKAYRSYVGGVVGFNGEGGHSFTNITSNINVFGSTCDVGGAFGIAHYNNKFENVTVTGNVTIYAVDDVADADEIGGIAGVWHNENGTSVSFTNCTFTGKLTTNVTPDLYNNTIVGAAYSRTGNGTLVIDGKAYAAVNTGDELKAALADNKNVIFVDNITMAATESNAYGKTAINVKYGQTIDGNGYTFKATGAGATWDSAISTTGGLIKNLTVAQGFRGIFVNHNSTYSEKVVLENVTIQGPTYTMNCDQGTKKGFEAINCTFNGWTSYAATIGSVKFVNCNFGKGAGYKTIVPYTYTEFVGCNFIEGITIYFEATCNFDADCTYNNQPITGANIKTIFNNNKVLFNGGTVVTTTAELQAAIDAGKSNIVLSAGEFEADLYVVNASRNLTITGQGAATTLNFKKGQVRLAQFDTLTIDNCKIGRMLDKSWGQIVFGGPDVAGGVYTISNCIFEGKNTQGIYINNSVASTFNIVDCTFDGNFGNEGAITIQDNNVAGLVVNVTGCTFTNIPETSHEIAVLFTSTNEWTLNAGNASVWYRDAQ